MSTCYATFITFRYTYILVAFGLNGDFHAAGAHFPLITHSESLFILQVDTNLVSSAETENKVLSRVRGSMSPLLGDLPFDVVDLIICWYTETVFYSF